MTEPNLIFGDDILRGAAAIAEFVLNDRAKRRAIYHLCATSRLPVFRLGSMLCARRSVLLQWVASQEGWAPQTKPGARAISAPPCAADVAANSKSSETPQIDEVSP